MQAVWRGIMHMLMSQCSDLGSLPLTRASLLSCRQVGSVMLRGISGG